MGYKRKFRLEMLLSMITGMTSFCAQPCSSTPVDWVNMPKELWKEIIYTIDDPFEFFKTVNTFLETNKTLKKLVKEDKDILGMYYNAGAICTDESPLNMAVCLEQVTFVKGLLKKGVNLEKADRMGCLPLKTALIRKNHKIFKLLLKAGVNTEANFGFGLKPLHWAICLQKLSIAKMLITNNINIEEKGFFGQTSLHMAANDGHTSIVKLLINAGANRLATDRWGRTPLALAKEHGHQEIVEMLQNSRKNQ